MAKSDGTVYVDTLIDTKGFGKGVNTMQKQIGGLSGAIGKLGGIIGAAFAVGKLIQFGKEAIDLGSDLQEVQNVVDVTFTTMNEQVNEFAKNAAETAGLSETMAKRYTGTFGAMAKAFGFAESESFAMSTALTQLAGDVASFYNITQDEAYTKLKSVFTGETETLKDLGVVMTQTALDSFAMAEGYGKTTKAMSEAEKVALRFAFVTKQLSAASGDFIRTQDSWANQTRILSLNFDSFKANVGQALINIFTPFLKIINQIVEKMAQLSQHFVAFSEMLVGKSTSGGGGSPGEAQAEIAQGYEDIADATNDATKAQKQYMTGLDEIRTFQSPQEAQSGGIGAISPAETEKGNEEVTATNSLMDKLVKKVKQLKDLFKQGFTDGLGDTTERVNSLKDSFDSIKKSLSSIFDTDFTQGLDDYIQSITQSFGTLTGSFASIGLTIGTNLLGGLSGFLESEAPNIKQYFLDMFDIGASLSEKGAELSSAFAYIFESFASENGQQITEDIIAIFGDAFMSITELLGQFALDVTNFLVTPFVNSKDDIKTGLDDLLAGISEFTGSVREVFDEFFKLVSQFYTEHISPIFEKLMPEMEELWQKHIAPLISKIGGFFKKLGEDLLQLWTELIQPLIQLIIERFNQIVPFLLPTVKAIIKIVKDLFGEIMDIIGNILDVLGGVIDFIVGVFTCDWEKAWQGIVDIFKGIFNTIIDVVELVINVAIDIINGLIGGINNITDNIGIPKIPDIPKLDIPHLATGAVIPPNAPFMAVLGDQKRGTNIEAPLDTIKQAVREVVGNGSGGGGGGQYRFSAQINRRVLFEEFIEEAKLQMSMTGHNPLDLRT